jgi:hypothetical protein
MLSAQIYWRYRPIIRSGLRHDCHLCIHGIHESEALGLRRCGRNTGPIVEIDRGG